MRLVKVSIDYGVRLPLGLRIDKKTKIVDETIEIEVPDDADYDEIEKRAWAEAEQRATERINITWDEVVPDFACEE